VLQHLLAQEAAPNFLADKIDSLARTPLSQVLAFVGVCTIVRIFLYPYLQSVAAHKRTGAYTAGRIVNEGCDALVYAGVFVFLIIRPYFIQAFKIPSGSMLETLQINDFIIANKAIYRYTEPKSGDIIVFRPPKDAVKPEQLDNDGQVNVDFIKRCIGLPGDLIEIRNGTLIRNSIPVTEPYIKEKPYFDFKLVKYHNEYWPVQMSADMVNAESLGTAQRYWATSSEMMEELRALPAERIPKGYLLMIGDNRNGSFDGRCWGLVPRSDVIGRSEIIWLPISRWRSTRDVRN
jgi:signal peptidase I